MAKGARYNPEGEEGDVGNVEADEIATNRAASEIPLFAGEAKLAVTWITPVYNQKTREAPDITGGKK